MIKLKYNKNRKSAIRLFKYNTDAGVSLKPNKVRKACYLDGKI